MRLQRRRAGTRLRRATFGCVGRDLPNDGRTQNVLANARRLCYSCLSLNFTFAADRLGSAAFFCGKVGWGLGCGLVWLRGRFDGSGQEVANGAGRNDRSSADFGRLNTALGDLSVEGSPSNAHQTGGGINAVTEFFGLIV
jgi:hypothetical protein